MCSDKILNYAYALNIQRADCWLGMEEADDFVSSLMLLGTVEAPPKVPEPLPMSARLGFVRVAGSDVLSCLVCRKEGAVATLTPAACPGYTSSTLPLHQTRGHTFIPLHQLHVPQKVSSSCNMFLSLTNCTNQVRVSFDICGQDQPG